MSAALLEGAKGRVELHFLHLRTGCPVPDNVLSLAERQRAAAFRSSEAACLFVAGRVLCRNILAEVVDCAPESLDIAVSSEGRPYLPGHPEIDFNLSHTTGTVALAVCLNGRVGIDIERAEGHDEAAMRDLMSLILSKEEEADLRQLPSGEQPTAFLARWVAKEAVLKCRGRGLLDDPRRVTIGTGGSVSSSCNRPDEAGSVGRFHAGRDYGHLWAVATENPVERPAWHHHHTGDRLRRKHR